MAKQRKRVVALAFDEGWRDGQLLKDCGVIPYLLCKNHGCDASMVGGRMGEYPSLRYVDGLKLQFLPDNGGQEKLNFLRRESAAIDCLILYGPYPNYFPMAECYKQYNPEGKIYLVLDANSAWMDRILWKAPEFRSFMARCDVIGTSGRVMQRHLNEKWPWPVEFLPNGFYHFTGRTWDPSFGKKENVILTVARLGVRQKRTDVLLKAFAGIADRVPDWELRLAGNVAPEFEAWLAAFWKHRPELRSRIRFLGNISDRDRLYEEYLRAKIFALPSEWEGGTPNVIAEALAAGDVIAITNIDEYRDATDHGRCGLAGKRGDSSGFGEVLLRLCLSPELAAMSRRACQYAGEVYDMERIVARLYYMLFGEGA